MKATPNNRARVTIPKHAGPHVRLLFSEMRRQGIRYVDLEERSGVKVASFKAWRTRNVPETSSIEATLQSVGWTLTPIPSVNTLPPHVVDELRPIAAKLELTMPETVKALTAIVAGIHSRFGAPQPAPTTT